MHAFRPCGASRIIKHESLNQVKLGWRYDCLMSVLCSGPLIGSLGNSLLYFMVGGSCFALNQCARIDLVLQDTIDRHRAPLRHLLCLKAGPLVQPLPLFILDR